LRTIAESLASTREKLSRLGLEAEVVPSKSGEECKLFIGHGSGFLKVEVNHVFRGTVRPVETREMVPFAREFFATGLETRTLAPADFCGGDAFVKQHIQLEKIVVRPGDGAVRLRFGSATARQPYQFGTTGTPNVHSARQRLSKRDGRDAAPSASDFCGAAAPVKQHVELEKIGVRPRDGASRLRFGSAAASRPYPLERWGRAQRAIGAAAPFEKRW